MIGRLHCGASWPLVPAHRKGVVRPMIGRLHCGLYSRHSGLATARPADDGRLHCGGTLHLAVLPGETVVRR